MSATRSAWFRPAWLALGCAVGGGAVGVAAGFVQAQRSTVLGIPTPWGLVLALAVVVATVRGASWLLRSRVGGVAFFVGWLVVTVVLSAESGSGDLVLSSGPRQFGYLFGGVVLGAAAAAYPLLDRRTTSQRAANSAADGADGADSADSAAAVPLRTAGEGLPR